MKFSIKVFMATVLMVAGLASPSFASERGDWAKAVKSMVAKTQTYPRSAINDEIEGSGKIVFTLDANGAVINTDVVDYPEDDVLIKAMHKFIEDLTVLPAPPASMLNDDGQLQFVLPISWRL